MYVVLVQGAFFHRPRQRTRAGEGLVELVCPGDSRGIERFRLWRVAIVAGKILYLLPLLLLQIQLFAHILDHFLDFFNSIMRFLFGKGWDYNVRS